MEIARRKKSQSSDTYSLASLFGYDDEENQGDKNKRSGGFFKERDILPFKFSKIL